MRDKADTGKICCERSGSDFFQFNMCMSTEHFGPPIVQVSWRPCAEKSALHFQYVELLQLNRITWVKRFDIYLLILFEIPQLHRTDSNLGSGYIAIYICFFNFWFLEEKSQNLKRPIGKDIDFILFINFSTNVQKLSWVKTKCNVELHVLSIAFFSKFVAIHNQYLYLHWVVKLIFHWLVLFELEFVSQETRN